MIRSFFPASMWVGIFCLNSVSSAETLSLESYLGQVRDSHLGFRAAQISAKSFEYEAKVAQLALSPYLFGAAQWIDDSKPVSSAANFGDQTQIKNYSLGISKFFSSGTQARVSYNIEKTNITGASAAIIPQPDYYQSHISFELSQSLWRNFFGSETRAMIAIAEAEKLEISFNERFRMKSLIALAETTYWRAFAAQKTLKVRESGRDRARKLSEWSSERARLHLADRSDFLQAQAALKGREFELSAAKENLVSASIAFNSLRGIETPEILETLTSPSKADLEQLEPPVRASLRDDTYAARERKRQAESSSQFSLEKARPNLDLTGSFSFAGRDSRLTSSASDSFSKNHPTIAVGINLNAPIDFWNLKKIHDGAQASQRAADLDYQRKLFDQERDWAELSNQFESTKEQLRLAREVEQVQSEKLQYEQDRLKKGRTTTFQVLTFEQDYATARLNLIQTEAALLTLAAQMRTFSDGEHL